MELYLNVKLYNVEGISNSDTPYFSDLEEQDRYFNDRLVKSIPMSYFPPFFTDSITFDDTDLSINTKINYLSIEYDGKVFYYFINSIKYTNAGCISLGISMDTIQTFMFNFKVKNGIIERKFIDRWNYDGTINRNYLRENFSNGLFQLHDYKQFESTNDFTYGGGSTKINDYSVGLLVFKATENIFQNDYGYSYEKSPAFRSIHDAGGADFKYRDLFMYYFLPITAETYISRNSNGKDVRFYSTDPTNGLDVWVRSCDLLGTMNELAKDGRVVDIKFIPFNPFYSCARCVNASGYLVYYNGKYSNEHPTDVPVCSSWTTDGTTGDLCMLSFNPRYEGFIEQQPLQFPITPFNLTKNVNIASTFSSSYVPALLDENYIRITFGDTTSDCTYPLYMSNKGTFKVNYLANIMTGSRSYIITADSTINDYYSHYGYDDKYTTIASNVTPEYSAMLKDEWQQWQEHNKSTIIMALGSYAASAIASYGMVKGANSLLSNEAGRLTSAYRSSDFDEKNMMDFRFRQQGIALQKQANESNYKSQEIKGGITGLANIATSELNAWLAPKGVKTTNSWYADLQNGSLFPIYKCYYVNDLEQCAQYYHRNGYLVNEYYDIVLQDTASGNSQTSYSSAGHKTYSFTVDLEDGYHYVNSTSISVSSPSASITNITYYAFPNTLGTSVTVSVSFDINNIINSSAIVNLVINYNRTHERDILEYVHTRYYFNVLKMSSCDIYLNCIESDDITEDIKYRLMNGIRLWDTDHCNICDFRLDNVERSYIQ